VDTVHECDRQTDRRTDGQTELLSQRPCNAERRTVKTAMLNTTVMVKVKVKEAIAVNGTPISQQWVVLCE